MYGWRTWVPMYAGCCPLPDSPIARGKQGGLLEVGRPSCSISLALVLFFTYFTVSSGWHRCLWAVRAAMQVRRRDTMHDLGLSAISCLVG